MTRVVVQGLKAGGVAGLIWGGLILSLLSPLMKRAERVELAQSAEVQGAQSLSVRPLSLGRTSSKNRIDPNQKGGEKNARSNASVSLGLPETSPAEAERSPLRRAVLTLFGSALMGIAFGVVMSVCLAVGLRFELFPKTIFDRPALTGALVGVVGFLIFHGIPSLGMAPELPGVCRSTQDLGARQSWWFASILCSFLGLLGLSFYSEIFKNHEKFSLARIGAFFASVGVISLPFLKGVPASDSIPWLPGEWRDQFFQWSLGVNLSFWLILGSLLFYFFVQIHDDLGFSDDSV
ncbi:MAG: CbtA family protein [Bdellovibrionia bacterium]